MHRLRQLGDENGQAVLIVALCMLVLIGFLGLAVDMGYLRLEHRRLQAAADAAALAGALEVRVCGGITNCGAMQTAATAALAENGYSGATVRSGCTASTAAALTLTLNNPVCLIASDPNVTKPTYVEAVVSETVQGFFAQVLGFSGFHLSARAEAAHGLGGPCIYALNPSASAALNIAVGVGFKSNCGVVVESSSPTSVNCLVGLGITAPELQVSPTGGGASLLCLGSTHSSQQPLPVPADPLAYLPVPSQAAGACGTTNGTPYTGSPKPVTLLLPIGNVVFNPGVYCGGISITAAVLSNITFKPGMYILNNYQGPPVLGITPPPTSNGFVITVAALTTITGSGVTIYNQSNSGISLTLPSLPLGLSNFALSAPASGEYGGILFFQPKSITNTDTFIAPALVSGQQLNGVIYSPGAMVSYAVAAVSTAGSYNGIVADKIQFNANVLSTISNDYSTLQAGSPLNGDRSTLVQ